MDTSHKSRYIKVVYCRALFGRAQIVSDSFVLWFSLFFLPYARMHQHCWRESHRRRRRLTDVVSFSKHKKYTSQSLSRVWEEEKKIKKEFLIRQQV